MATLLDKLWDPHVIADLGDGWWLLHVDRVLLHDLSGWRAMEEMRSRGLAAAAPKLAFATPDHAVSTAPGRRGDSYGPGEKLWSGLRDGAARNGIDFFDLGQIGQGIVHVMGPEMGITLPGTTLVCGDSHTCTNGGLGALAFGIGSTELVHVLATQVLRQRKPRAMRVRFEGRPGPGVSPKDLVLHLVGRIGADGGTGHAVEFAGEAIRALPVEGRMTICNMAIELGAKMGFVAPDETTFAYIAGRPYAPQGEMFERAVAAWRDLVSDEDAVFDREVVIDASAVAPTVSWGTSPEHTIAIDAAIPAPEQAPDADRRAAWGKALDYMGLDAGRPIAGTPVDWVFIGSCTNSRIGDLREAAAVARGRKVAPGVRAWIVPGSEAVKRQAEAEGLDAVFLGAGFEWREPGCSLCVAANGERVPEGARCASTSNRNFVGRQGPGARTHLMGPAMAAAAAVTGTLTDVRRLGA
ncbi:3-isopropylmalate dehydratase large subunit [Rhodovarius crocodyli]|uniref:3-isopropylmalate dehydratase n=1 Tax=Rhodovarius crocodyli TaxID=1979269 RepID=A0A437M2J9_9PROT|nr:3-isopropylmalate dehydratase large subunit [Rhodovarius crocodyli]RVT91775.1 3-isopropylmalate dehydratase large subunit [Rhodovarius crocodyli]